MLAIREPIYTVDISAHLYSHITINPPEFAFIAPLSPVSFSKNLPSYVRVDSPSDLIHLDPHHPFVSSVVWKLRSLSTPVTGSTESKAIGDRNFREKQYELAEFNYTQGLNSPDLPPSTRLLLVLNRAQCRLNLERFASAYLDATTARNLLDDSPEGAETARWKEKALVRAGKALEGLRQYPEAIMILKMAARQFPSNKAILLDVQRLEQRLRESQSGSYDWVRLYKAGLDPSRQTLSDVLDFTGPIEIKSIEGRGGGK